MQMSRDQSMQMYKKLALLLHPDKNQHPLAKEAFQKLSEANKAVSNSACWKSSWTVSINWDRHICTRTTKKEGHWTESRDLGGAKNLLLIHVWGDAAKATHPERLNRISKSSMSRRSELFHQSCEESKAAYAYPTLLSLSPWPWHVWSSFPSLEKTQRHVSLQGRGGALQEITRADPCKSAGAVWPSAL